MCGELRRQKYILSSNLALIKSLFVLSCLTLLIVECRRQKRDIRHMIILTDEYKPPTRHKKFEANYEKPNKKPDMSNNEDNLMSASNLDQYIPEVSNKKTKPKRHKKVNNKRNNTSHSPKRNKKRNKPKFNDIGLEFLPHINSYETSNAQWDSSKSQQLHFDNKHQSYHASPYMNGQIINPKDIDIRTPTPNYYTYNSRTKLYPTVFPNYYQYDINQNHANWIVPTKTIFPKYEPLDYKTIQDNYETINLNTPYQNHKLQISSTITPDKDVKPVLSPIYETDTGNVTISKINDELVNGTKENKPTIAFGTRMKPKRLNKSNALKQSI